MVAGDEGTANFLYLLSSIFLIFNFNQNSFNVRELFTVVGRGERTILADCCTTLEFRDSMTGAWISGAVLSSRFDDWLSSVVVVVIF